MRHLLLAVLLFISSNAFATCLSLYPREVSIEETLILRLFGVDDITNIQKVFTFKTFAINGPITGKATVQGIVEKQTNISKITFIPETAVDAELIPEISLHFSGPKKVSVLREVYDGNVVIGYVLGGSGLPEVTIKMVNERYIIETYMFRKNIHAISDETQPAPQTSQSTQVATQAATAAQTVSTTQTAPANSGLELVLLNLFKVIKMTDIKVSGLAYFDNGTYSRITMSGLKDSLDIIVPNKTFSFSTLGFDTTIVITTYDSTGRVQRLSIYNTKKSSITIQRNGEIYLITSHIGSLGFKGSLQ